jgi:hypothetical protein
MCWINEKGKLECYDQPRKWYHLNQLYIEKDSAFLYQEPVQIKKKDTIYSASDGAFYYYAGTITKSDSGLMINLQNISCDYCGTRITTDSATGFMYPVLSTAHYKLKLTKNGIQFNGVDYVKSVNEHLEGPFRAAFYFDSNSIYRVNPKGQYRLMSQGIKCFLQTSELIPDNDTIRICTERLNYDESVLELLNPDSLHIDTAGFYFKYYSLNQIDDLTRRSGKPVRYILIREIVDYMKAARISLLYKISLPENMHQFSEHQMHNLFEFTKTGNEYILTGNRPENSWELIEKK